MRRDVGAELFERLARKCLVEAFDFLQANDVRLALGEPTPHRLNAGLHGIDVPGRDTHAAGPNTLVR